mmetsp:Transcript_6326/g.15070  ORF Transcript_6326/g.15070 Transcript_6326/m.15070 type:complete len:289 (+) Transcript_6326:1238-2104(+)
MCQSLLRARHETGQSLGMRDIHKAVSNPKPAHHLVIDLMLQVEGCLDAILVHHSAGDQSRLHGIFVVSEHVKRVGADEHNGVTLLGPDDILWHHINAADEPILCPVIETNEIATTDAKQATSVGLFYGEGRLEGKALLEVLEDGDLAVSISSRISAGMRPAELQCRTVGFVAECLGSVDYKLAIATNCKKTAVWVVRNVLREDLCCTHVLHTQWDFLALPRSNTLVQQLEVCSLDLIAFGPYDLARVHGHDWLLASKLDHDSALIVSQSRGVRALEHGDGPDAFQEVA